MSIHFKIVHYSIKFENEIQKTVHQIKPWLDELAKLEWAIGSIIHGDSKKIQKFIVLYGSAGTGKSTMLNIIQMLFEGYYSVLLQVYQKSVVKKNNHLFPLQGLE